LFRIISIPSKVLKFGWPLIYVKGGHGWPKPPRWNQNPLTQYDGSD